MKKETNGHNKHEKPVVENALSKEVVKDMLIQEMKEELYQGSTDIDKIMRIYQMIVGNTLPVNINVAKRTILRYGE